jgi:hypothetical protein
MISGTPTYFAAWENARGLFLYDGTVFWTQLNLDNSIRQRIANGPGSTVLLACNQQWPSSITVDVERVYWINKFIYDSIGRIMALERAGGEPAVLLDDRAEVVSWSLAADLTHLYWIERSTMIMRTRK